MIYRLSKLCRVLALGAAAIGASAQTDPSWDTSGNSLLNGEYRFRQVIYVVNDFVGNLARGISLYGTLRFDGAGGYTLEGMAFDSAGAATPQPYTTSGTYSISAAGFGFLSSTISEAGSAAVYGLVSGGIFVGSSTESGFNDLLIAAPVSGAGANAFTGEYAVAHLDFPDARPAFTRNSLFTLRPDGQGGIAGPVNLTGYVGLSGDTLVEQQAATVSYTLSGGTGTLSFPQGQLNNQTLIAGAKTFYLSPDGRFVFGGSDRAWDFFAGVRVEAGGSAGQFGGLYYEAGISQNVSLTVGRAFLETWYGALNANAGRIVGHQRVASPFNDIAFDYTYTGSYSAEPADPPEGSQRYVTGLEGAIRIGSGVGPELGLSVALRAPELSGPGVFLNPAGVVNAASSAPFTAGLARGQFISLYGSNLAPGVAVAEALPFPESLGGVEVMVNGRRAPVYAVSPGQVSAIVPYETELSIARIEVINNGERSNAVTAFMNRGAPGVFTIPPGGIGHAAALHADNSLIEPANPAQPGEIVAIYVTGLGDVNPPVRAGEAGPSNPFSVIVNPLAVLIDGIPARLEFAGLAPTLAGLYQINAEVPAGVTNSEARVEVVGPDAYAASATLPVAVTGNQAAAATPGPGGAALRRFARESLPRD